MKLLVFNLKSNNELVSYFCKNPTIFAKEMAFMIFNSFDMDKDRFDFKNSEVIESLELDLRIKKLYMESLTC